MKRWGKQPPLHFDETEENREIKPYYTSRFNGFIGTDRQILIRLKNGYEKGSPYVDVLCRIYIEYGREDWGAEKTSVIMC